MSAENADRCINYTIDKYEGGYDNDSRDRGNWTSGVIGQGQLKGTKYGIASHVYPNVDIKNLTKQEAIAIYKRDYWPKVAGDQLPTGFDMTPWDACVNSGPGRALKWLGSAVGSTSGSPRELAQLVNVSPDKVAVIKKANAVRRSFLIGLQNATYEKGWLRRVANCEAISIGWYVAATQSVEVARDTLNKEAKTSDTQVKSSGTAAGGAGAGGAAAGGHTASTGAFDLATAVEIGMVVALVVLTAFFAYKLFVHRNRAAAMRAAVAEIGG